MESGFKYIKNERSRKCIVLPYINGVFERVSSHLKDYLIDCVPKSNNDSSYVIVKGKDKIKNHLKNNAVYKVNCFSCDSSYVGQTKRYFKKRKSEHKNHKKSAIL